MAIDCAALGNLVRSDLQQTGPDRRTRRVQTREKGNYSFHAFGSSWLPLDRRPGAGERGEKRAIWAAPDPRPLRVTGLGSIAPSPGINHDLEPASQPGQG